MGISHEIMTDIGHYKAIVFDGALNEYEFQGKFGPVIGIPGVDGGWHKEVRNYLAENNIGGVLAYFGPLTGGVDSYLTRLDKEINKYPNSLILGFSAGGILALRYAQKSGWDKFRKIITVATPFDGIPKSLGVWGKTLKEISTGSPLLAEILEITPPKDKVLSLFSREDRYTKNPYETGKRLHWPYEVLEGKSHGSLQSSWNGISPFVNAELGIIPSKK